MIAPNENGRVTEVAAPVSAIAQRASAADSVSVKDMQTITARIVVNVRRFIADHHAYVERKEAEAEARIARYRAEQTDSDVIVCPRCLAVQTDEARCQSCGRHSEP